MNPELKSAWINAACGAIFGASVFGVALAILPLSLVPALTPPPEPLSPDELAILSQAGCWNGPEFSFRGLSSREMAYCPKPIKQGAVVSQWRPVMIRRVGAVLEIRNEDGSPERLWIKDWEEPATKAPRRQSARAKIGSK